MDELRLELEKLKEQNQTILNKFNSLDERIKTLEVPVTNQVIYI